jgi:hypothetical protein
MADGVPITAGSGTTVATDDCGMAGHAQVMKLAVATDGSAALVPADGTNGLAVDVTRLPASSSASLASVADTTTSATLLAANTARRGFAIFNDSASALFLKFGATASATSFTVRIEAGGYYEMYGAGVYTGILDGLWAIDAAGDARVTEW